MRKVHVKVEVDLFITANDDADIGTVIDELEYSFTDTTGAAEIEDSTILDYTVVDSR